MSGKDKLIGTSLILLGILFIVLGGYSIMKSNETVRNASIYKDQRTELQQTVTSQGNDENIEPNGVTATSQDDDTTVKNNPNATSQEVDSNTPVENNTTSTSQDDEGGTRYIY